MTSQTLVLAPGPRVKFYDGSQVIYAIPRDTLDPRHKSCTDHHVACDCREAEVAEDRHEARAEYWRMREAFMRVLAGHQVHVTGTGTPFAGEQPAPCMCTGCQIAREIGLHF